MSDDSMGRSRRCAGSKGKTRLDELLVARGLFPNAKTAASWVMAGSVIVDEERVDKPGAAVRKEASIRVRGIEIPYVSRGGLKLAAALDAFGLEVAHRVAIDAGASTGGFTDCLLKRGALRVYSVDVGFGQLAGSLRQDPRVVNMERTNIGDVARELLVPRPDLGVMDLSYLSLSVGVPTVAALLADPGEAEHGPDIVALVKPLFEVAAAGPDLSAIQYRQALERACAAGVEAGCGVDGLMASPVLGSGGTLEFLAHYMPGAGSRIPESGVLAQIIERAIDDGTAVLHAAGRKVRGEDNE
ncbi:MAG: TlyA family RNA methyltransferase [Clostridia bacterium]|nr:TlyA family RNA methyltransferase [Clostridia bacterium]